MVAIFFGALLAIAAGLDLACVAAVSDWAQDHPVFLAAAVEAVLLLGTHVVIERVVAERERERWNRAAQGSVFDLWFFTQTVVGTFADWERKAEPGDSLWRHFTRSVQTLRATVDKTEPRMQATPELARLWPASTSSASASTSFVDLDETEVCKIIDGPRGTLQDQVRGLQTNADELVVESQPYANAAAKDELDLGAQVKPL